MGLPYRQITILFDLFIKHAFDAESKSVVSDTNITHPGQASIKLAEPHFSQLTVAGDG